MQIVIKIPDDFYERVNKDGCMSYTDAEVVVNAFYRGEVLPKGHGALKDAGMIKRFLYSSAKFWGTWNLGKHRIFNAIDNVGAVIEADEEVDE